MPKPSSSISDNSLGQNIFAGFLGLFLGLALLKFGNPIILESKIEPPKGFYEFLFQSWPLHWSYIFLVVLVIIGLKIGKWKSKTPRWILILPLIWLGWQFAAATQTIDSKLTSLTLQHFSWCVVCFYLGWFALSEVPNLKPLWIGILLGFVWVIRVGLEQHFGGLAESKRYFELYVLPTMANPPPELVKKVSSTRIFSTLFYPNSLAGALLLFLPITLFAIWQIAQKFGQKFRFVLTMVIGLSALACLYWSGSKAGWLIMLLMGLVALLHVSFNRKLKLAVVGGLFVLGLCGFFVKYAGFFAKGATSVSARFDYWRAAAQITRENPVFGTGPGTFSISYEKIKSPGAEMARLCHNDYLEQACDSGILGFLTYFMFVSASLTFLYRHRTMNMSGFTFYVWLGLLGLNLQSFVEFNLYIPALAWPNFVFLGWLWGLPKKTVPESAENRMVKSIDKKATS